MIPWSLLYILLLVMISYAAAYKAGAMGYIRQFGKVDIDISLLLAILFLFYLVLWIQSGVWVLLFELILMPAFLFFAIGMNSIVSRVIKYRIRLFVNFLSVLSGYVFVYLLGLSITEFTVFLILSTIFMCISLERGILQRKKLIIILAFLALNIVALKVLDGLFIRNIIITAVWIIEMAIYNVIEVIASRFRILWHAIILVAVFVAFIFINNHIYGMIVL